VPIEQATIMLVVDVSFSMDATDVEPTRMAAATSAAQQFVRGLPDGLSIGLVAFDRSARVLAAPTTEHATVERSIQHLTTGPGTAAGDAIFTALDAIAVAEGTAPENGDATPSPTPTPAPGNKHTAAIVLLSDGVTTVGRPVEEAAAAAAERRRRRPRSPSTAPERSSSSGPTRSASRRSPTPRRPSKRRPARP
jgi:Ca-activated chloride channel family protein